MKNTVVLCIAVASLVLIVTMAKDAWKERGWKHHDALLVFGFIMNVFVIIGSAANLIEG